MPGEVRLFVSMIMASVVLVPGGRKMSVEESNRIVGPNLRRGEIVELTDMEPKKESTVFRVTSTRVRDDLAIVSEVGMTVMAKSPHTPVLS